ncbi:MAG: hypothetical protein JOZ05_16540, partial [Acetobacteraceae bacterium]|nr:hypothetical protein [Acetobacteraceae bacterium]
IVPAANVTVDANDSLQTRRTNWSKSLNFLLLSPVVASGSVSFNLVSLSSPGGPSISCDSCANTTQVTFYNEPPLIVRAIGLSYTFGSPPTSAAPSATDFALLRSWLGRAYPVSSVNFSQTTVASANPWPFTCDKANAQLAAIRASDISTGTDARTHYYGLVSNSGGYMRGCSSGAPATPDPSTTASGPAGPTSGTAIEPINVAGDTDGSFADWYGGHELGHTFGRNHPGFCNGNSHDDPNFPYPNGQIGQGNDTGYAGLDVGDSSNGISRTVLWPSSSFDIMTYCNQPQWLSAYTYEAVRQRLLAENPGFLTLQLRVGAQAQPGAGPMVHVAATLNLARGTGAIEFVTPVERGAPQVNTTNRAALVVRDASGRQLSRTPVALRESTDIPPGEDQTALVDATVPFAPDMAQVDLVLDGRVLAQYRSSTAVPAPPRNLRLGAATQAAPTTARPGPVLTWQGPPGAAGVTYTVQTSDDGKSWSTIAVGLREPTLALSPEQARARLARVIASNGFRSAAPVSTVLRR